MHSKITRILFIILTGISINLNSQKTISRSWTSFTQSVEVQATKEVKFKLTGNIKVISDDPNGVAGLWARVDNKNKETGFFDNMMDRPVTSDKWETYLIEGTFDKEAKTLNIGGLCMQNGDFYFDDLKLLIADENGDFVEAPLVNASFEQSTKENPLLGWSSGIAEGEELKIEEYDPELTEDATSGNQGVLIKGRGAKPARPMEIVTEEGYTPQMGILVSMLDALKERVEGSVKNHSVYELDYLMDEKANSIGSLIMHLAAAEKLYQVMTFEGRYFNSEEEKVWGPALNLGDSGREQLKNHEIDYYLNLYDEVRSKTKEELAKRDDNWLQEEIPGAGMTNFYGWFHVMEHQSSHLGQILLLQKRIKPEEKPQEIKTPQNIKN